MTPTKRPLFPKLVNTIQSFTFESLSDQRKTALQPFIDYVQNKVNHQERVRLNLICTHNSRRSHLAQVWAQTAAHYYHINDVFCYSGGTETTALFPMVAQTLTHQGFQIETLAMGSNPIYAIKYSENEMPILGFSKTFDSEFNPKDSFAAILTCSQADEGCPFIAGAEKRIALPFEDPKLFDGTPLQAEKYEERSNQIATELFYVFSQIKHPNDNN